MLKETTKPDAAVQKTKFRFYIKWEVSKYVLLCGIPQQYEQGLRKCIFRLWKVELLTSTFARRKRGKTCNLLIIYNLSLPMKYELNTRCYITRQHGWNENIRRQPLGIARPCINTGTACCIYRNLQTTLCEYLCSRVEEVNKNILFRY